MSTTLYSRPTRQEILREIKELTTNIAQLRLQLPQACKCFWRFRVLPGKYCWAYSDARENAAKKVHAKMDVDYPKDEFGRGGWAFANNVVDEYITPEDASANAPGSLLRALTREDALSFLRDWDADCEKRVSERPPLKDQPASALELDIKNFRQMLRQEAIGV